MNALAVGYFPSISFFSTLLKEKELVIYPNANYDKNLHLNRCMILTSQRNLELNIPLLGGRNQKNIMKEIKIAYHENWILHHEKSLITAYKKSPWLDYFISDILIILNQKEIYLLDLNTNLLAYLLKCLDLKISITYNEENKFMQQEISYLSHQKYNQVFESKIGFISNPSILDLLFNEGKKAKNYL